MLKTQLSRHVFLIVLCLALTGWLIPVSASAGFGVGTYTCVVDIVFGFTDCTDGVVTVTSSSGNQRVTQVDLNAAFNWQSLNVLVETCSPSGWTVNIGDSPTNNGGGGDGGSTAHDSEAELNGTVLNVFYSDVGGNGPHSTLNNAISSFGCTTQQWTVTEDQISYDDDGNTADVPRFISRGRLGTPSSLFNFPPYNEADSQDSSGTWADDIFVGLNRTVGTASRSGSGVQRACFFLSTSATPSTAAIAAACS